MTKLGVFACAGALVVGTVATADYAIIDIEDDGTRIWLPVPLIVFEAAAAVAPDEVTSIDIGEAAHALPIAEAVVAELRGVDDAELVRVEGGDETVVVRTQDGSLVVDVAGRREQVHVRVPFDMVTEVLKACDGSDCDVGSILDALDEDDGAEIRVDEGNTRVRIRTW